MKEERQLKLSGLLSIPNCCRILRSLIYNPVGFSLAELATRNGLSDAETLQIINDLLDVNLVQVFPQKKMWSFIDSEEVRPLIDEAIFKFELDLVRQRAISINYHAREKLEALDELATHIATARSDVRS